MAIPTCLFAISVNMKSKVADSADSGFPEMIEAPREQQYQCIFVRRHKHGVGIHVTDKRRNKRELMY